MSEQPEPGARRKRRQNNALIKQALAIVLLLAVSASLVYVGHIYITDKFSDMERRTETRIEEAVAQIQETNTLNINILLETLSSVLAEVQEIRYTLSEAEQTIGFSAVVQENLARHLRELEIQLEELQKAIDLLKGDSR